MTKDLQHFRVTGVLDVTTFIEFISFHCGGAHFLTLLIFVLLILVSHLQGCVGIFERVTRNV